MASPYRFFKKSLALVCAGLLALVPVEVYAFSRIKDLVDVEGIRDNMLVGYGLVVGLNGSGDSLINAPFTQLSLVTMLERLGVNARGQTMQTKDVAAVMVTANLHAFAAQGTRIDVSVSALGDAKSLQGGTLLVTPLAGADGEIYALAQGPVAIGGFVAQGQAASVTRGVPTRCISEARTFNRTSESEPVFKCRRSSRTRTSVSSRALVRLPLCPRQMP